MHCVSPHYIVCSSYIGSSVTIITGETDTNGGQFAWIKKTHPLSLPLATLSVPVTHLTPPSTALAFRCYYSTFVLHVCQMCVPMHQKEQCPLSRLSVCLSLCVSVGLSLLFSSMSFVALSTFTVHLLSCHFSSYLLSPFDIS